MKLDFCLKIMAMLFIAFLTSCQLIEPEEEKEDVYYEVIDSNEVTTQQLLNSFKERVGDNETYSKYEEIILKREEKIQKEYGTNGLATGYKWVDYYYNSVDQHGKPVRLSAKVVWGIVNLLFTTIDLDPDHIYIYEHYTITSDNEAPTGDMATMELECLVGDLLLIIPDYIGYGSTVDRLHPYIHYDVAAINSIDALEAGYYIFKEYSDAELEDDYRTYAIGCSQGAGNALAVHKYFDTHPDIAKKWKFDYSYCGSGPYSPSITFQEYFNVDEHEYPVVLPMMVQSMLDCYPDIMGKWEEKDFYSAKYLEVMDKVNKALREKKHTADDINKIIFDHFKKGSESIDPMLMISDSAKNQNSEMIKAFYQCLDKNDLTKGWTPTHNIKLYHGKGDNVVPYENALALKNAFGDKVEIFHSFASSGHVMDCEKYMLTLMINNW